MSGENWTKGPWRVQSGFLTVFTTSDPERGTGLTKALFKDCGQCDSDAEKEANAHLIAAAPELYHGNKHAEQTIEKWLDAVHDQAREELLDALEILQKSQSKARGEQEDT